MNIVTLIGNLATDVDLREIGPDKRVASFLLAVDRASKEGGADFVNVCAWDRQAELCAEYLGKGRRVAVDGWLNLGMRYAIDASPEPVTNGFANIMELALVSAVTIAIWHHPIITLAVALLLLVCMVMMVRLIWRALRQVFSGRWMPGPGLMQAPRVMERRGGAHDDTEHEL